MTAINWRRFTDQAVPMIDPFLTIRRVQSGARNAEPLDGFQMRAKHNAWMQIALREAVKAKAQQEVPVGAVVVAGNEKLLSTAYNQTISRRDPTAHAEILALRQAANKQGNYRLLNTTLYVTVEPCPMCMGAVIHARVARVVFGTHDPKWGAAGSLYNFAADQRFNHQPEVIEGICESESKQLLQQFFRDKRR